MNQPLRKRLSMCLAIVLGSAYLAGCGAPPNLTGISSSGQSRAAAAAKTPQQMATTFKAQLQSRGIESQVLGAVVNLEAEDGVTPSFDFSATPKTRKVVFRAGTIVTEIEDPSQERVLPTPLPLLGIKMIWGGAKAWYWYTHTHEGANYSAEELQQAILYGMIHSGVAGLPFGFLLKYLTPIVWKWVTGDQPLRPTLRDLFELMKKDLLSVSKILADAEKASD